MGKPESCFNLTVGKPESCLIWTVNKLESCLNWTVSKLESCLNEICSLISMPDIFIYLTDVIRKYVLKLYWSQWCPGYNLYNDKHIVFLNEDLMVTLR